MRESLKQLGIAANFLFPTEWFIRFTVWRMTCRRSQSSILIGILLLSLCPLGAQSPSGRELYRKGEYDLASIAFLEALRSGRERQGDRPLLALSLFRTGRNLAAIDALNRNDFTSSYLRLYGNLRAERTEEAMREWKRIQDSPDTTREQKGFSSLLTGTVPLETGDYSAAKFHYERIVQEDSSPEVTRIGKELLIRLEEYRAIKRKRPVVAGMLSALLPGTGQLYADHTVDGVTAFLFNAFFIGSAAYANHLETIADRPHTGSALLGSIGFVFYLSNITGAAASAKRYNLYHERLFQQSVRDSFFHPDFVERSAGIELRASF